MSELCLYAAAEWTRGDLNPRPRRCKRRALPAELRAPHTTTKFYRCCWCEQCLLFVGIVAIVRFIEMTEMFIHVVMRLVSDH